MHENPRLEAGVGGTQDRAGPSVKKPLKVGNRLNITWELPGSPDSQGSPGLLRGDHIVPASL